MTVIANKYPNLVYHTGGFLSAYSQVSHTKKKYLSLAILFQVPISLKKLSCPISETIFCAYEINEKRDQMSKLLLRSIWKLFRIILGKTFKMENMINLL